jgi:hypothetical protein
MKNSENRFELQYFYNGELLEKATRNFDCNLSYPKLVGGELDQFTENFFPNSVECVLLGNEIEKLLRKVLKHDTQNYMYWNHTSSFYDLNGNLAGVIAKEGDLSQKKEYGNTLTFKIVDTKMPDYESGKKTSRTLNATVIERTINVDEYFIDPQYPPNFWMVFSNYSDESFEENKKISGDNYGIISAIFYYFSTKKYKNICNFMR